MWLPVPGWTLGHWSDLTIVRKLTIVFCITELAGHLWHGDMINICIFSSLNPLSVFYHPVTAGPQGLFWTSEICLPFLCTNHMELSPTHSWDHPCHLSGGGYPASHPMSTGKCSSIQHFPSPHHLFNSENGGFRYVKTSAIILDAKRSTFCIQTLVSDELAMKRDSASRCNN